MESTFPELGLVYLVSASMLFSERVLTRESLSDLAGDSYLLFALS